MTRQPPDRDDAPATPDDDVDWAGLRAAYETGEETVAALCWRFRVAANQLAVRRRAEGWPARPCDLDRLRGLRRTQRRMQLVDKLAAIEAQRPPVDVEAVRALYEDSDVPKAEIRRRFGLSEHELKTMRVGEGWTPRPQIANPGNKRGARKPLAVNLAARLMRALSRQIAMLEDRVMSDDYEQTDADIRLMNGLAQSVERIGKLAPGGGPGTAPGKAPDSGPDKAMEAEAADVEWMRDKLRKRLARLAERQRSRSDDDGDDA